MRITYQEVINFINTGNAWLSSHDKDETKFKYALRKVMKRAIKEWNDYTDKVEDLKIEYCSTDDKKNIMKDDKEEYVFTKEGLRSLNKARKDLFNSEIKIEYYEAKDIPSDLTDNEKDSFAGFIIPEVNENE